MTTQKAATGCAGSVPARVDCRPRFVFLGANTPWVRSLAEALATRCETVSIAVSDYGTQRRQRDPWAAESGAGRLTRVLWLYPPGYLGVFAPLFRPLLGIRLRRWLHPRVGPASGATYLIACYPWLAPPQIPVPTRHLIYFNLDEYTLYRPERATQIRRQEATTVGQARLVICLSVHQVEQFRARLPAAVDRVRHLPLGVRREFLSPVDGVRVQDRLVAYVGNLGARVDWHLILEVARRMPDVTFTFAGDLQEDVTQCEHRPDWRARREEVWSLPNVRRLAAVPQAAVVQYYWSAAVNWIPYDVDHPFNRASCPTKIMDGLASGRPLLSADLPECRLYPDWIGTFRSAAEAELHLRRWLVLNADGGWPRRGKAQVEFAGQHLWSARAATLLDWLKPLDDPSIRSREAPFSADAATRATT